MTHPAPASIWSRLRHPDGQTVRKWLTWHPTDLDRCIQERANHRPEPLDSRERDELRQAHQHWHADEQTLRLIEALGDERARVVVAGQQPSLLAGPLLVIYKAIGAIKLARRLKQRHPDLLWVPVFWVASEDHDFDELRRVFWPTPTGQLQEFRIPSQHHEPGRMVGRLETQPLAESLIRQIDESTQRTEFTPGLHRYLGEVYCEGQTLESSFARLMLRLFAGSGLVLVTPRMEWVIRRSAPTFAAELDHPGRSTQVLLERADQLSAEGLEPTLHRPPNSLNLFWVDEEGRRYTLRHTEGEIQRSLPGRSDAQQIDQPPVTPAILRSMLAEDPGVFSANVVTRALIQDAILPTAAQIVGPGEAGYLAQVEAVYPRFGVFAPVRYPRPEALLIEPRIQRQLEKYHVDLDMAIRRDSTRLAELVLSRTQKNEDVTRVEEARQRHKDEIQRILDQTQARSPAIDGAFDKLRQMLEKGYETIIDRLLYHHREDQQHLNRAMALINNCLMPGEQSQERRLNPIVPFANRYGLDWVLRLMPLIDVDFRTGRQDLYLRQIAGEVKGAPEQAQSGDPLP